MLVQHEKQVSLLLDIIRGMGLMLINCIKQNENSALLFLNIRNYSVTLKLLYLMFYCFKSQLRSNLKIKKKILFCVCNFAFTILIIQLNWEFKICKPWKGKNNEEDLGISPRFVTCRILGAIKNKFLTLFFQTNQQFQINTFPNMTFLSKHNSN